MFMALLVLPFAGAVASRSTGAAAALGQHEGWTTGVRAAEAERTFFHWEELSERSASCTARLVRQLTDPSPAAARSVSQFSSLVQGKAAATISQVHPSLLLDFPLPLLPSFPLSSFPSLPPFRSTVRPPLPCAVGAAPHCTAQPLPPSPLLQGHSAITFH
jgi:hypothetical protein